MLNRLVLLRPGEAVPVTAAACMFFCIMLGYGVVKPLRDAFGIARGADNIPWLMTATLAAMAVTNPIFSALIARRPARVFLPWLYRFFIFNIAIFGLLRAFSPSGWQVNVGYAFYVWLSVFNLLALSVFWGVMSGVFTSEQSRRTFGLMGVGGTLGLIGGAFVAKWLSGQHASSWVFMLATAAMLEASVWCCRVVTAAPLAAGPAVHPAGDVEPPAAKRDDPEASQGVAGAFAGIAILLRSPYFLGISAYLLIYTVCSSLFYVVQQTLISQNAADEAARTGLSATIDLWANVVTLGVQVFLTGRIVRLIGLGGSLAVTPVLTLGAFAAMGASPTLSTLMPAVITRRGLHYAVDKPAREMLYAGLSRDARYKTKSFIDTVVYRGGDVLGGWVPTLVKNWGLPAMAVVAPLCALAIAIGAGLAWARRRDS